MEVKQTAIHKPLALPVFKDIRSCFFTHGSTCGAEINALSSHVYMFIRHVIVEKLLKLNFNTLSSLDPFLGICTDKNTTAAIVLRKVLCSTVLGHCVC